MFVLIARYWNEIEWVRTSLKYILQWNPDKIFICEGNWSSHPSFIGREQSTDGTAEIVKNFVMNDMRAVMLQGHRSSTDYRTNQAATCREALRLSGAGIGDWFITIDCDSFVREDAIPKIRELMKGEWCYFPYIINHFFWDVKTCVQLRDIHGNLLPRKILAGGDFCNANHYGIKGKYYTGCKSVPSLKLDEFGIQGHHYLGIKDPQRIVDRYNMGDKLKWKPEVLGYDKKKIPFTGIHPIIAKENLEILAAGGLKNAIS